MEKGLTIYEAARKWVNEFNAIPQGMIAKLMQDHPDEWREVTLPSVGDRVYCYFDRSGAGGGEVTVISADGKVYTVELDAGETFYDVDPGEFEVIRDDALPMWGTMWSFGSSFDDHWLTEADGLRLMSECGIRVYEHDEWGYFFGIDGAGYDFIAEHWVPLYKKRGMLWHDPVAEEHDAMQKKGCRIARLGNKQVWVNELDEVIKEVQTV